MAEDRNMLSQVAVRLVEQPPLLSDVPMENPDAVIRVMNDFLADMDRELFCIVNLQSDLRPINMNVVSVGALNEAMVHPREIVKSAVLSNAASMIMIHNHPSGRVEPSREDVVLTNRMQQIGNLMGIPVLDHIITGRGREYYSFKEKDTMPMEALKVSGDIADVDLTLGMVAESGRVMEENTAEQYGQTENGTITNPLPVQGKDMDSIMKSLESGVEELFTSTRYADYLKTMAKFHRYSFNNTLLIAMQRPDATLVTGYKKWQSMGRQVKKGEKGITIIAPAPVKQKRQRELRDENSNPVKDADGNTLMEEVEVTIPKFRPMVVFDIDQTTGDPIQTLAPEELTAAVDDYDLLMEALTAISPAPMRFDNIDSGAKGYYNLVDKEIVIQSGMSESQTIKTAIHEQVHARLHDRDLMKSQGIEKDKLTKEVEAESGAFCVASALGIDTGDYSFPYIAGWSSGKEMKELKASMDTIRQTSGEMIDQLTAKVQELIAERQKAMETPERKAEQLATDLDSFAYAFDQHGYEDAVEDREAAVASLKQDILSGNTLPIQKYLQEIVEEADLNLPENVVEAKSLMERLEHAQTAFVMNDANIRVEAKISFFVAECMEFPVMGVYKEGLSLQEAITEYEKIPADRMNGIKGIGFNLQDGSDYDGNYDLLCGDKVQRDSIELVQHYKNSPLVQKAMAQMESYIAEKQMTAEKKEPVKKEPVKKQSKSKKKEEPSL